MTEQQRVLAPGFYRFNATGATRYWDGQAWTGYTEKPESPVGMIFAGILVMIGGGALIGFSLSESSDGGALAGYLVAAIGSLLAMVGVVAQGVRLGNRASDYDRQLRAGGPRK